MRDSRSVQKFLPGIKCPWLAAGKSFVTGLDTHKNDFVKTTAYLASFVQHSKGGGLKISVFHAQGSGGGFHRGRFSRGGRDGGGCNGRVGRGGCGCGGGRGAKPDICAISYTDQEWALLSYDDKGKVFALCDKA